MYCTALLENLFVEHPAYHKRIKTQFLLLRKLFKIFFLFPEVKDVAIVYMLRFLGDEYTEI